MKFFNNKNGLTLVELITSLTISAILFGIVVFFTSNNVQELADNNMSVSMIEGAIEFESLLSDFGLKNYTDIEIIENEIDISYTGTTNPNPNDFLILKKEDNSEGVLIGIVDINNMKLQKNYVYGNNYIGYRDLTENDINEIALNKNIIFEKEFLLDKVFQNLRTKDFNLESYNNGVLVNIYFNLIKTYGNEVFGIDFQDLGIQDVIVQEYNLVY